MKVLATDIKGKIVRLNIVNETITDDNNRNVSIADIQNYLVILDNKLTPVDQQTFDKYRASYEILE